MYEALTSLLSGYFLTPILQGLIVNVLTYAILQYYKNRK